MKRLMLAMIRFYQKHISSRTPPCCRFVPTCSQYAVGAIERFGAARGFWLALCRLLKCHPLHPGGYDPVPKQFSFFSKSRKGPADAAGHRD